MKKAELPPLCKTCIHKDSENLGCAGYAFRVALNDFKSAVRLPIDKAIGREPKEYDYSCCDYQATEKTKAFYKALNKLNEVVK